jgi:hypothetical protein
LTFGGSGPTHWQWDTSRAFQGNRRFTNYVQHLGKDDKTYSPRMGMFDCAFTGERCASKEDKDSAPNTGPGPRRQSQSCYALFRSRSPMLSTKYRSKHATLAQDWRSDSCANADAAIAIKQIVAATGSGPLYSLISPSPFFLVASFPLAQYISSASFEGQHAHGSNT